MRRWRKQSSGWSNDYHSIPTLVIAPASPLTNTKAMNTRITTALGLVAGFIGGAMSHYLFDPLPARA